MLPDPPGETTEQDPTEDAAEALSSEPSVQFTRETWWDSLLTLYALEDDGNNLQVASLTAAQRSTSILRIFTDIRCLFQTSVYWGSFIHLPRFFETILDPTRRPTVQPGLILGMLAMGTFVQSCELRRGAKGRSRALKLIDQAHAAIQASLSANWVDIGLIQAAWVSFKQSEGCGVLTPAPSSVPRIFRDAGPLGTIMGAQSLSIRSARLPDPPVLFDHARRGPP